MGQDESGTFASLTAEQVAFYHENGYLVVRNFATPHTVSALLRRSEELLHSFKPESNPSVFSTTRQTETSDEYFLKSANNVSFFLEEGALNNEGKLTRPIHLAVNKFGHGTRVLLKALS